MKKAMEQKPIKLQAEIVRPRRRLLASLADLFLFYIITALIYMLAITPITRSLPSFKNAYQTQQESLKDCRQMYLDGHLIFYDNGGNILSNDLLVNKFIVEKVNKDSFDENGQYVDPFYYFYLTYANDFLKKDNAVIKYTFEEINNNYLENNKTEPVLWEISTSEPANLTETAHNYLLKYINKDITAENKAYYDKIVAFAQNAFLEAEKVLVESDQFKDSYSIVMKENQVLYYHFTISSILTYFVFYFLYFLLVPALFKNGQTFANKILKISFVTREDKPIPFSTLLLRSVLQHLGYYFFPLVLPYLILGNATFSLPMITIANFTIDLWLAAVIGLLLCITSFIFCLVSEYKQNFYDKIVDVYAIDLRYMHVIEENKENNNEENLWK